MAAAKREARQEMEKQTAMEKAEKSGIIAGVIAGALSNGQEPSLEKASEIAGVDLRTKEGKEIVRNAQNGIHAALARAGISDDRIAQVLAAGIDAKETRLVIEHGEVKDAVEFPDWHARHKFVTAILQTKGYLVKEDRSVPGSLIVINPTQVNLVPGHSTLCQCDACCQAWTERARKNIAELAEQQKALKAQYAGVIDLEPEPINDEEPAESKPAESSKPMTDEERLASWEDD